MAGRQLLSIILFVALTAFAFADTSDKVDADNTEEMAEKPKATKSDPLLTANYRIISDVSEEYAEETGTKMEAALTLYNTIFRFDLKKLGTKMKVTIYKNKNSFDSYLKKIINQTREDFVYIHYSDLVKCELVGYQKKDEAEFNASLLHQGMIQFVKAFVPAIPLWLAEGMAAYIETSQYNAEAGTFTLIKNLSWLDSLKGIMKEGSEKKYIPLADLLVIEKDAALSSLDTFYPEAWGLVYFLINTENRNYNRLIWDAMNRIDPALTLSENSEYLKEMLSRWVDLNALETDYRTYILSIKTYYDEVLEGIVFYTNKDYVSAEPRFTRAIDLKPTDYFAYYYMGLIKYSASKYLEAEDYYKKALTMGAEKGLTYYALGVNAYADNRYENAVEFLKEAKDADADSYMEKADTILQRIEAEGDPE
jgi:tetratricopeptide (TPR) repeat protein